jgi:transmembrane sensor
MKTMNENIPWEIIQKMLKKTASDDEMESFKLWLSQSNENKEAYEQFEHLWKKSGDYPFNFNPDAKKALSKVKSQIVNPRVKILPFSRRFVRIAAILALLLGLASIIYYLNKPPVQEYNELVTIESKKELILPDGSHVWLNSSGKLKYPIQFDSKQREVYLDGEAYFEIAKNAELPFVINALGSKTKVIGTKFNVRAYRDEAKITVTVEEGKVSFFASNQPNGGNVILSKGDEGSLLMKDNKLNKRKITDTNYLTWKTEELVFDNTSLEQVFETLCLQYHLRYTLKQDQLKDYHLTATYKHKSLDELLNLLSVTFHIQITRQNDLLVVSITEK